MKKDKNKTPLTSFGEMLKKAIIQPLTKSDPKQKDQESQKIINNSGDSSNSSNNAKSPNSGISPKVSNPEKRQPTKSITNSLSVSAEHTANSKFKDEVKAVEHPRQLQSSSSNNPNQPLNTSDKNLNNTSGNFGKFKTLMQNKFWKNVEGESPSGHQGRPLRINLGVDLGTSFSKVVYRVGSESYPVLFGTNKNKVEDYLIPSVVVMTNKGIKCKFELNGDENLSKIAQIPNFKICLTCEKSNMTKDCTITKCNLSNLRVGYLPSDVAREEATFLTSFYLGKLFARTKDSVRRQLPEQEIPSDITIKWSANLAVPDKFIDSEVADGFREALEIGWLMSEIFLQYPNFSNKQEAIACFLAAKELQTEIKMDLLLQRKDFDCFIYSEIGAEVASVTLSPTSDEGLYVLVDVGAGTVDTSVFNFRREMGDAYQETWAANILKLGAAQIDARANATFTRKSLDWLRQIKENVFHSNNEDPMIHVTGEIKSAQEEVITELGKALISVYREAFNKEPSVETWSKLKLVMGGGGSAIKAYGETARKAFSPKLSDSKLIEFSDLKVPKDFHLNTIPTKFFHRFAVAYGLSHNLINLPELLSASKIQPKNILRQKVYIDPTNDG